MRRKKIKLQNLDVELRSRSVDNPSIFRGIVAHVNGYTQPSLNDLHHLIVSHGGGFLQYLDGKTSVTHIIASGLTPKKKVDFARYRVVKPAWVVESVKAGKLLPWDAFRLVDEGVSQKVLGFKDGNFVSQANLQPTGYRDETAGGWHSSQVKGVAQVISKEQRPGREDQVDTPVPTIASIAAVETHEDHVSGEEDFGDDIGDEYWLTKLNHRLRTPDCDGEPTMDIDHPGTAHKEGHRPPKDLELQDSPGDGEQIRKQPLPDKNQHGQCPLTAEEHNARLLSDPHIAKSSTANPDFLNQYYRESRLHHLSTWKAELKAQLLARTREKLLSKATRRLPGTRRYILHVDFDSFFAAVSLRKSPHLAEKPVVIAHGNGPSSEIASCNYPARSFGIKNGMWMKTALQLCSDLKVLPYDFKAYEEASRHFYDAILSTDGVVQSVSIDEALIDVSRQCVDAGGSGGKAISEGSIHREQAKANEIAQTIRSLVKEKTDCEVSVGIGGNILQAKVALRKAKPAGQYLLAPDEVLDFIGELKITDLPGVAYSLAAKLEELGVKLVKEIRALTKERLVNALGPKTGEKIWEYSRGIDRAEVGEHAARKSVSAEISWGIRFVTQQQADEFVQCLCDELSRRLLEQGMKGRHLTMKIMRRAADAPMDPPKNLGHGKCDTFSKSVVLGVATNDNAVLGKEAVSILKGFGFSPGELRGLGVQMTKLEPSKTLQSASLIDSSQRRLQFKKHEPIGRVNGHQVTTDESSATALPSSPPKTIKFQDDLDPIEDVPTPKKPTRSASIAGALTSQDSTHQGPKDNLLNVTGTQFILPSQVDPSVLAELPADIRSKLAPKQQSIKDSFVRSASPRPEQNTKARSPSPAPILTNKVMLSQSQIDPEIFGALPEDVQKELLEYYTSNGPWLGDESKGQRHLPQSPRKSKSIVSKNPTLNPAKRQRTLPPAGKSKSRIASSNQTLRQSAFVAVRKSSAGPESDDFREEVSESFLAELPEDIRAEILAEQKRNRLKQRSGLELGTKRRKQKLADSSSNASSSGGQGTRPRSEERRVGKECAL